MADKTFHSIKFPGLLDTYKIPDIVNEYSASSAYAVGDYILKDGKTYKCTTAIASSGELWNTEHWTEVKIGNDLQSKVADLKSALNDSTGNKNIQLIPNRYIDLSGDSVTMSNGVPQESGTSASYSYGLVSCSEGDKFTISGTGGGQTRLWGFVSNTGTITRKADASKTESNLVLTAQQNEKWLIIHTNDDSRSYIGELLIDRVKTLEGKEGITEEVKEALMACFEHVAWINDNGLDYYDDLYEALYGVAPEYEGTVKINDFVIGSFFASNNTINYTSNGHNRVYPNPMLYKTKSGNVTYTATLNNSTYQVSIARIKSTAENDSLVTQDVNKVILSSFTERDGSLPWTTGSTSLNVSGYDYIMPMIRRADDGNMTSADLQTIKNAYTLIWRVVENG